MPTIPIRFIDELIEVEFREPPVLAKSPPCPSAFIWQGETISVAEMLEVWQNFQRRGRFARNMRPSHTMKAAQSGSWGVGRFHYVVRVRDGRIFELYYDRAPESAGDRLGHWFLLYERKIV